MRARFKGINTVRRKLASGLVETYYYHRATGARLKGKPGSPEFIASIAEAVEKSRKRDAGTLAGLMRDFEETAKWRRLAASTQYEYRRVFRFWEDTYGSVPHAALEDKAFRRAIVKWHDSFSADKPREADNRVTILSRVLSWAAKDGPLGKNVLEGFDKAYKSDRSDKIWLPEHFEAFMAVASAEMQLAMVLALHTGQRQGDLRRLAWGNYDGSHLRLTQQKTKRYVAIKCTKALKATLDGLERRSPLILTTKTGRPFQKRYLAEQWAEAQQAAAVEDLHFHDIRGTTVTMLFEAGCNLGEIAAVTGHSLRRAQDILDKYLARTSRLADSAIAKFENVLETDFAKQVAKRGGSEEAK
ncbi:tyrosine-type recombinase/integrase [Martelella soudanensis]|uniref:tyrosine-type recombinase/integrase n=1 Tax=unclassified Martelella TaxID=2629616 RepID=UPI0015DF0B85|nr:MULTISPECIES: tyrosine-type recombinase/integrase [unclassified Martelella]